MVKLSNGKKYNFRGRTLKYIGRNSDLYTFYNEEDCSYINVFPEDLNELEYSNSKGNFYIYLHSDKESVIQYLSDANLFSEKEIALLKYMATEIRLEFEKTDKNIYLTKIEGYVLKEKILWETLP